MSCCHDPTHSVLLIVTVHVTRPLREYQPLEILNHQRAYSLLITVVVQSYILFLSYGHLNVVSTQVCLTLYVLNMCVS